MLALIFTLQYNVTMKKIIGTLVLFSLLFAGTLVFAVGHERGGTSGGAPVAGVAGGGSPVRVTEKLKNPIKYDTFSSFVEAVIEAAVQVLMPFVILAFVYSGFLFVKAQGKETELETAKKAIYWSVIGAFILLGAWGFAQIIGETVRTITA